METERKNLHPQTRAKIPYETPAERLKKKLRTKTC